MTVKTFIDTYSQEQIVEFPVAFQVKIGLGCIIEANGNIELAHPSHEKKIVSLCKNNEQEVVDKAKNDYFHKGYSFLLSICLQANVIAVFDNGYLGKLTKAQKIVLERLKMHDIYHGYIGITDTINTWKPHGRRKEINIMK